MGSYLSFSSRDTHELSDPVTGLTVKQVKLLKISIKEFMKNPSGVFSIFVEYFRQYPQDQKMFRFRDVPLDDLKDDLKFKVHCTTVLYNMASWIENADNSELLTGMLEKLGSNHSRYKITAEQFLGSRNVIIEHLSPMVSKEVHTAYVKLFDYVMIVLRKTCEEK